MAKKSYKTENVEFQFAVCELTSEDKPKFEAWVNEFETDLDDILRIPLLHGYKVSVKADTRGGGYLASMTQAFDDDPNYNRCLTARAGTAMEAFWLVLYKHVVVLDSGVWPVERQLGLWG